LFDVLNVACGGHAGDDASMARIAAFCATRARPRFGAHPSFPDREGFGPAVDRDRGTCARRARALAASGRGDAICVHGDTPGALAIARAVREALG